MSTSTETAWEDTDERRVLGASLRRLLDVVVRSGVDRAELAAAAEQVDTLTERLQGPTVRFEMSTESDSYRDQLSLVGGLAHPIAPQLRMVDDLDNPELAEGVVVLGPLFQGGPGLVHGGVLALLIDHAMGHVAAKPERPAMTARLTLHFRRPTPLGVPLTVTVRLDRIEGRKLHLAATVSAGGVVTVDAEAIFLTLTEANLGAVFGDIG